MLEKLRIHGFRTLMDTEVQFTPLTIMIGKNGAGKTSILDSLKIMGNFARGGVERAFGPPPWSLGWQLTRGMGTVPSMRFDLSVSVEDSTTYEYTLSLIERESQPHVIEERLTRMSDHTSIAHFSKKHPPRFGSVLKPGIDGLYADEISKVSQIVQSVVSYELNPSLIEQGTEPEHDYVSREGFGVAGFLAHLKDNEPTRFGQLEARLKQFRPDTESIDVWASGKLFWGLRDKGQDRAFPAVHLSWGDRQLVGLLCVLYATKGEATIAIEEIDRGFHPSRYAQVIELLSEVAYDGLDGQPRIQVVVTTHSPSFVSKLGDRLNEIRMVTRAPGGGTVVRPLQDLAKEKLGPGDLGAPLGEIWEMGLLEEVVQETMS